MDGRVEQMLTARRKADESEVKRVKSRKCSVGIVTFPETSAVEHHACLRGFFVLAAVTDNVGQIRGFLLP